MDWFVPGGDKAAVTELRHEVRDYLRRHAAEDAEIGGAELAFAELLTNAVEHTANSVWVTLDWVTINPVVTIHDLGPGFELDPQPVDASSRRGRGLMIASHLTRQLTVAAKRTGGSRVSAVLDVKRAETADHDFDPNVRSRLPEISEAEEGLFSRDSFLRALVVQVADTVEFIHGPAAAESVVAQVGATVGGRMEAALRQHHDTRERLTPSEIARFYVDLKASIGGDFYIVSVDDDRIVLGNRRCPFGEAVTHAPSLCRMTSSVFGGIAARNIEGDVAVHLEERIAVGDPECRVTIWLEPPPSEVEVFVHRYKYRDGD